MELARPRDWKSADFKALVDYTYNVMTNPELDVVGAPKAEEKALHFPLRLDVDDLLTIVDAAALLGFATVEKGDVAVTEIGQKFALSDILTSKEIFSQQLVANVPFAVTIYQTLAEKSNRSMKADFFINLDK